MAGYPRRYRRSRLLFILLTMARNPDLYEFRDTDDELLGVIVVFPDGFIGMGEDEESLIVKPIEEWILAIAGRGQSQAETVFSSDEAIEEYDIPEEIVFFKDKDV